MLYIALRGLSHKTLLKIRETLLCCPKEYNKKFAHIILAFTSKLIIPITPKIKDRLILVLPYLNKIMDQVNLSGILNSKKLKSLLPVNLKYTKKPTNLVIQLVILFSTIIKSCVNLQLLILNI